MTTPKAASGRSNIVGVGLQERRLGPTVLNTYRTTLDIDDIVPNDRQPRLGAKEDEELQRQIVANEGLFEPLLVEPHPDLPDKHRIIDGERRWTNSSLLVSQGQERYRKVPVEITDRTLSDEERLRIWIYIHRQRKEWDAREKEMVAYRLVDLVGRASAANILGISLRELDKFVEVYELSSRFSGLRDPGAAITWARELRGISKKLLTPPSSTRLSTRCGPSASPTPRTCASSAESCPIPSPESTSCRGRAILIRPCCGWRRPRRRTTRATWAAICRRRSRR